jgi:large subunit ribosomal protein L10
MWSPMGVSLSALTVETNVDRQEKTELVASLNGTFKQANLVVVTHNLGMTVAETTDLRQKTRKAGAGHKVTKNRLTRLALAGTKFENLGKLFTGPTAITYSQDPVAAAKVVVDYAKSNEKLVILGAALGDKLLDVEGVKALATLPSLDQLRGKLLGMLQTPASRIASVLQAPGGQVARVIAAHAKKGEAA